MLQQIVWLSDSLVLWDWVVCCFWPRCHRHDFIFHHRPVQSAAAAFGVDITNFMSPTSFQRTWTDTSCELNMTTQHWDTSGRRGPVTRCRTASQARCVTSRHCSLHEPRRDLLPVVPSERGLKPLRCPTATQTFHQRSVSVKVTQTDSTCSARRRRSPAGCSETSRSEISHEDIDRFDCCSEVSLAPGRCCRFLH